MYAGSPTIFNVPEITTLRRVKPLPKRRRTSAHGPSSMASAVPVMASPLGAAVAAAAAAVVAAEEEEELLARADSLSARMALQSYYMPMLGSVQEFLAAAAASAGISAGEMFKDRLEFLYGPGTGYHGMSMGMGFGGLGMGVGMGIGMGGGGHHEEDDSYGDGDYVNHLQQPGNTKKRKVPANVSVSQRDDADSSDHTQDEGEERDMPFGRAVEYDDVESSSPSCLDRLGYPYPNYGYQQVSPHASMVPTLYHGAKRGKLTAATLAGLQHKEMLKTRKRQLAAVLGALSHGDTLALDQALSMSYVNPEHHTPKIRLSKRKVVRTARMAGKKEKENQNRKQKLPVCEFTFVCPSATADRLIATKEEVKVLRSKFEAELARQAEQLAAANNIIKDESLSSRGKKKKRSALANESNPHHLRNYVPSRLAPSSSYNASHTHSPQQQQQQQSWVSPLPVRFLSAEIPPRRRRREKNGEPIVQPTTQVSLMDPADEWICAFCEYDLFYGDDVRFRRAVRNRKKILKRRRRARERAAAAASGRSATSVPVTNMAPPPPNAGGNVAPVPPNCSDGSGPPDSGGGGGGPGAAGGAGGGGQTCLGCSATSTPEWRRGPLGAFASHNEELVAYCPQQQVQERYAMRVGWCMPSWWVAYFCHKCRRC
ncbi:hypothetical protein M378DRAFT_76773 [Amanita muscaria Koide BX008]|uniref:GATA-type domain-containing protein n=1 Tax=Amanita muscaria (strain Koide BX008) TaxID=946122 RepID=A0A0C2SQR3_AMAMK|nr:hypothetical protein M378DRAFT_76773 [Amanita muscaria Koide BX008]